MELPEKNDNNENITTIFNNTVADSLLDYKSQ